MKKAFTNRMKPILIFLLFVSCATAAGFVIGNENIVKTEVRTVIGEINYNSGFYLPGADDVIELSLLSSDGFELSHQKLMNIHKFPYQFILRYDAAEVSNEVFYYLSAQLMTQDGEKTARVQVDLSSDKTQAVLSL